MSMSLSRQSFNFRTVISYRRLKLNFLLCITVNFSIDTTSFNRTRIGLAEFSPDNLEGVSLFVREYKRNVEAQTRVRSRDWNKWVRFLSPVIDLFVIISRRTRSDSKQAEEV